MDNIVINKWIINRLVLLYNIKFRPLIVQHLPPDLKEQFNINSPCKSERIGNCIRKNENAKL